MLDFLPAGKTFVSVKTRGFPGRERDSGEYEFAIDCRNLPFELTIPGSRGGPDTCHPYFPEQEIWLDELAENPENGIKRIWDCQWSIEGEAAARKFLLSLQPFGIKTEYY